MRDDHAGHEQHGDHHEQQRPHEPSQGFREDLRTLREEEREDEEHRRIDELRDPGGDAGREGDHHHLERGGGGAGDGEAGADGQDDGQRQHDGEPGGDAVGQVFEAAGRGYGQHAEHRQADGGDDEPDGGQRCGRSGLRPEERREDQVRRAEEHGKEGERDQDAAANIQTFPRGVGRQWLFAVFSHGHYRSAPSSK